MVSVVSEQLHILKFQRKLQCHKIRELYVSEAAQDITRLLLLMENCTLADTTIKTNSELILSKNLSEIFLMVNSPAFFVSISCGDSHTIALTSAGAVYAFGDNANGQLGTASGGLVSQVQTSEKIIAIAAGNVHSVFLGESGTVYTCGGNSSGQLGQNHLNNLATPQKVLLSEKVVSIGAGYMHTVCVTENGDVNVYGFLSRDLTFGNSGKVVGSFKSNDRLVQLSSGSTHILALTASGTVYGFGVNGHGQLGLGQNGAKFLAQFSPINGLRGRISYVACGFQHSLCSNDRGEVFGFGRNERSQLGSNNTAHQYSPIQIQLGFSLKDIFCLSSAGALPSSSLPQQSSQPVDNETVELTLPERQYHQGFQSFKPQMVGVSSESTNLPPPTQNFSVLSTKKT